MNLPKQGLVSVLIPAYNRRKYIAEAIDSVLAQTYEFVELIVADDGSTDGTFELLEEYAAKGVLTVVSHDNRQNLGQSAALNLALSKAKGEFIAILDSDDFFAPEKLAVQVEFLKNNPSVGMVYSQGLAIAEDGTPLYSIPSENHEEHADPNDLLLDCYIVSPGCTLVRKSIYDEVGGFEESLRAAQDHDMALRQAEAAPIAYLPGVVFYYRKHGDSISVNGLERRWRHGFEILERARSRYSYRRAIIRKRRALLNFRMAQVYWNDREYYKAIISLLRAGSGDPVRALGVLIGKERIR